MTRFAGHPQDMARLRKGFIRERLASISGRFPVTTVQFAQELIDVSAATAKERAQQWLDSFEHALTNADRTSLGNLFCEDCHWRDLVAFTWTVSQFEGKTAIVTRLIETQTEVKAARFSVSTSRTPPRRVSRAGVEVIEAIFDFETPVSRGEGLLRLPVAEPDKAWVLLTSVDELKGHEEPLYAHRPSGSNYSKGFGGENWLDIRKREQAYSDREPAVIVVGAGQAGLGIAARLKMLGVDTLVVERHTHVGDNWRSRYHSLTLHNEVQRNHMPYIPFPPNWPKLLTKDMLAGWFEMYAWAMELNVWTATELRGASYDEAAGQWLATVRRQDGSERQLRPRHLIFANGVNGIPKYLNLPGFETFKGEIMHTHHYRDGSAWKGKRALVLGTGSSGHDVAQDLHSHGADVAIVQRSSTTVVSIEASQINHVLYAEGFPIEDSDLIASANTNPILIRSYQLNVKKMVEMDNDLIAGLKAKGFKLDMGEDDTGHQMKLRRRGGGYYLNVGCSELIVDGKIRLLHFDEIDSFGEDGAKMKNGRIEKADLIVTASGYLSPQELVRHLLGSEIADKIGPVWGIAPDGEMNNMYRPTAQKGLWFMGGGLAQCRIYSKPLALQIKALEEGLIA
ncbi:NAD(P)/FAD-dependent oxidoreductase [Rhizobium leguminosarum bv. viciae]|uniref:flavin-containing monooxygenase n=1 Tax=Rhizobium leguminosarum TaxID=384 RepID=UPI00103D31CC|nr:NAD(P)/FAD-dependent oxidoreductase [Rhizobium leguminosarum]MBY5516715.1 NAD(P)/FAD-dependent oxidoreductase [Rhizobium leguminosarum]TCA57210.1 NAD(P)/FAD-dependent oxidoreductase [Rhizobium leguminosarum bv. viciae]TCA79296.1 NAD(P)/FAD-dependent oxidoreductase [Rhizobium leguminosarum bv. viciae]